MYWPYFRVVNEWLEPLNEPLIVEAFIQMSYFVLRDNDVRVYEVVLAGTVMPARKKNRNQRLAWQLSVFIKKKLT